MVKFILLVLLLNVTFSCGKKIDQVQQNEGAVKSIQSDMELIDESNKFSFDMIKKQNMNFYQISDEDMYMNFESFPNRPLNNNTLRFQNQKLYKSKTLNIDHYYYNQVPDNPNSTPIGSEYLIVNNNKIELDKLFKHTINGESNQSLFIRFDNNYEVKLGDSYFIILQGVSRIYVRNVEYVYRILLKVSSDNSYSVFSFIDGNSTLNFAECFGIFNSSGNMCYLDWGIEKDTVSLYILEGNKFLKDREHYIILLPSESLRSVNKTMGINTCWDSIDFNRTKWFYPLIKRDL